MTDFAHITDRLDEILRRLDTPDRRWLGVASAATYCDLSSGSIRRLIASGKLTARRPVKGKVLVDRRELDGLILESTAMPRNGRGRKA